MDAIKENNPSCGLKREWQLDNSDVDNQKEGTAGKRIRTRMEINQSNNPMVGVASHVWPQIDQ